MASNDPNPFAGFDFSKVDVQKMFADFKMPGLDVSALLKAQQKNIAALTQANQHAAEGLEALARRQREILQQAMKGAADAAKQVVVAGGPKEAAAKQAELAKAAFEQAVANMRDMAEMVSNSSNKAFDVISKRVTEGLEELKQRAQEP
jgi:phasin family protein